MRKKLKTRRNVRLYHPGRIIHLRHIGAGNRQTRLDSTTSHTNLLLSDSVFGGCCPHPFQSKNRMYAAFVTNMYNFAEIMISSSMLLDHLPDNYVKHLDALVQEWDTERKLRGSTSPTSISNN
jgi:hypothetical protein